MICRVPEIPGRSSIVALALAAACACSPGLAFGQTFQVIGGNVQKQVNGVLALMGYMLTPDVTTGSLSISNSSTGNPDYGMSSLGGGVTASTDVPLYLEGTVGYSRYDPTFVASNGQEERSIPTKWNAATATGGVGWDFPIAKDLVLRPIFNFSFGRVASDGAIAGQILQSQTGTTLEFLKNGQLDAYGLGGSLMLDYELHRPEHDIDVELRYTDIHLQSYDGTSEAVQGSADAQTLNLWTRWRAPTGITMLDRPLRYVLEYARTDFYGDLRGALGFNSLNSVGVGLELDSSKYDMIVTRTRLVYRFKFGENVRGWSLGLAVSF